MIVVEVGKLGGRASIEDRTWSADQASVRQLLQDSTDRLFIHGGIPDADEFIVSELSKQLPLQLVAKSAPAEDPEATDAAPVGVEVF